MRGAGTLRTIIGRPIYGKQKQQLEPDLHEAPPKKQKQQRTSTGGVAAGQKSIFNFYAVAAPPAANAPASSQQKLTSSGAGVVAAATSSPLLPRPRLKSAPLPQAAGKADSRSSPEAVTNTRNSSPEPSWPDGSHIDSPHPSQADSQGQDRDASPAALDRQQQQQQQQNAVTGPLLVSTKVVGRQHQSSSWPPAAGSELLLQREATNPVDPCAILVCSVDGSGIRRTHGHLPAAVACHLAPLMDKGQVLTQVTLRQPVQAAAGAVRRAASEPPSSSSRGTRASSGTPHALDDTAAIPGSQDSQPLLLRDPPADPNSSGAQQQQQQRLQLHITLLQPADADAATAALSAVDRAASAGLESLQPGRSSGALLAAAFDHIMSETRKHDMHLLSSEEQGVLQQMQSLPAAAKALLLRLLLRKRTWFQLCTLAYADVPQPEAAASRLAAVGLLQWSSDNCVDLDSLLQELPVPVLKQVLAALLPKGHPAIQAVGAYASSTGGPNKAAVISSIQANACRTRLQAAIAAAAGPCVAATPAAAITFARLQLLYFASPGHDLSMFVAVERGAVSYPTYPIERTRPVFSSRQQVLDYEQALALAARVDAALEVFDNDAAWHLLQPALTVLQSGAHKGISWDEGCAPVPNPLPCARSAPPIVSAPAAAAGAASTSAAAAAEALAAVVPAAAAGCKTYVVSPVQILDNPALRHVPSAPAALGAHQPPAQVAAAATAMAQAAVFQSAEHDVFGAGLLGRQTIVQDCLGLPVLVESNPAVSTVGLAAAAEAADLCAGVQGAPSGAVGVDAAAEECNLTQGSSSDVSWDLSDSDGEADTTSGTAGKPSSQPQQQHQDSQQNAYKEPQQQAASAVQQAPDSLQAGACTVPQQALSDSKTATAGAPVSRGLSAAAGGEGPGPPLFFARFCAGWVHASLGTIAVSLLEKQKRWGDAVELLRLLLGGNACVGRRGDWWTRLAINLEHLGRTEDALEAVEAALADAWVRGGDMLGLQRRYLRLGKPPRRWKRPPWSQAVMWEPPEVVIIARPLNNNTGTKSRFYAPDNSLVTVEQLALQHYASQEAGGWQGLHCEGGVWATLFTLLLWDVIFMGVPDVFRSPFQTSPLDLDTDAFYPARRTHLDTQLTRIADGQAGAILTAVWSANAGVMARGVNWQRFTQQQLLEICDCVGGLGLAAVLRLMAEDHAGAAGGLPDLLLWRPSDTSAKLVEVKGPRDRLSHQQRFWLAHMANNTMQVEVLKVKEPQSNKRK